MKKELTLGTSAVPARLTNEVSKIRDLVNKVLPDDCQIKTAQDAWYAGAVGSVVLTLLFPPAVALVGYCVYRAKRCEKGDER